MTYLEARAVLTGLFKSAKRRIRQSWSICSEPYKLTGSFYEGEETVGHGEPAEGGVKLRLSCDWYKHGVYVRIVGDRLEVSKGGDEYLELADPQLEEKFTSLILAYFPAKPLD